MGKELSFRNRSIYLECTGLHPRSYNSVAKVVGISASRVRQIVYNEARRDG